MFYMKKILILALLCVGIFWCFKSCIGCGSGDSGVSDSGNLVQNEKAKSRDLVENEKAKTYYNYKEACKDGAFEDAHEKLEKIHETLVSTSIESDDYLAKAREYFSALEYIYKAEIQHIVTNLDDEACKDKLTFLISEIPIDGQKPDESLEISDLYFEENRYERAHVRPYKVYGYYATSHNNLLNHALTLAINRKYKKLAENILLLYIDDLEFKMRDENYHAHYSRSSYNAAKKKYDQAVRMQLFE